MHVIPTFFCGFLIFEKRKIKQKRQKKLKNTISENKENILLMITVRLYKYLGKHLVITIIAGLAVV